MTRAILTINLAHLLENYLSLKKIAGSAVAAAVVKDDAYGLGAKEVSQYLYEYGGCRDFFVAHASEGIEIRQLAKDTNIFVLQGITPDLAEDFTKFRLIPVVSTLEQIETCRHNVIPIPCVANLETGLNRLGLREDDIKKIPEKERPDFLFVMSHLACADEEKHPLNKKQLQRLIELRGKYFPGAKLSLAASDGVFLGADFRLDMVRLGAAIYGLNTTPYRENQMKPVVYVKAPILQIADLPKGETAGYAAAFTARKNMKIAIVSIGYGDGFPRSLSNAGRVFINGEEARVLGRVSMDNLIVDVTGIEKVKEDDYAEILNDEYTADDMGKDAGTIGYEIIDRFGKAKRMERKYIF